jgi:membrane protease YdiL (CAAX protease family)
MHTDHVTRHRIFVAGVTFEGALGLLALALGWITNVPTGAMLAGEFTDLHRLPTNLAIGTAAAIPMFVGLLLIERLDWAPLANLRDLVNGYVVPLFRDLTILERFCLAAAAGFGEELLFRGWLQLGATVLWPGWLGLVLGIALSAVLFGICHRLTTTYAVLAAAISVYLSLLMVWSGSLLAVIATHAFYDFLALVYLVPRNQRPRIDTDEGQ